MIDFYSLSSGSKGNATVIKLDNNFLILIDIGISKKRLSKSLSDFGLSFKNIKYVFITHSHIDHIRYINIFEPKIIYSLKNTLDLQEYCVMKAYKKYDFDGFQVMALKTSHDAQNPCGFVFYIDNEKLVYITDTGVLPLKTEMLIKNAEYYVFESNHDVRLLMESKRPEILKCRILSDTGHLSNDQSAFYMASCVGPKTKEIMLAHLSEECNSEKLAIDAYKKFLYVNPDMQKIKLLLAKQWESTKG